MSQAVQQVIPLGFPWQTADPFLFCVHHLDDFPKGNAGMGPQASLAGRQIGQDFDWNRPWRMYHGDTIPGFPAHPHRGFETVTVVTKGFVDHADSLGAAGRYGQGDTQWMTAGRGVQHSEMFPLLSEQEENHMELFQIWLNLPAKSKKVEPHFGMIWGDETPIVEETDSAGRKTKVRVVAGHLHGHDAPPPPPDSWAADADNEVAIWTIHLEPGARWTLPAASADLNRMLYFYRGNSAVVEETELSVRQGVQLISNASVELVAGDAGADFLLLQGKPIAEPIAQYGPFVMNTEAEIHEAFADFRRDEFGGWPWPRMDQVHDRPRGRFAKHADGRLEERD